MLGKTIHGMPGITLGKRGDSFVVKKVTLLIYLRFVYVLLISYWLSPEYQGQGIMAKALKLMLQDVSIKEVGKRKFNGHAHVGNWASRRTMEKAGFVNCPELEKVSIKEGKEIPTWTLRLILSEEDLAKREVVKEATPLPSLVQ